MKVRHATPLVMIAFLVAACSSPTPGAANGSGTEPVRVVTSTNVYGDLVRAVGGSAVSVTAIIDDPDKDPHEYAGDAQTQLALSKAQLVVENGGGYDDFVDTMITALPDPPQKLINVTELSGYDQHPTDGEFNEHLWYDFPTMIKLVDRLSSELGAAAPSQASMITENAAGLTGQLQGLLEKEAELKIKYSGTGVAITEPVPLYLLGASGLVDKTPPAFSEAVEQDSDVAPVVLKQTLDLLTTREVGLLAYNEQTTGPQTEAVLAAARSNGIPVVAVTETLPGGETYLSWMNKNVAAVSGALGQ